MNVLISSKGLRLPHPAQGGRNGGPGGHCGVPSGGEDYLLTFPDDEKAEARIADYKARLRGLEDNIWIH